MFCFTSQLFESMIRLCKFACSCYSVNMRIRWLHCTTGIYIEHLNTDIKLVTYLFLCGAIKDGYASHIFTLENWIYWILENWTPTFKDINDKRDKRPKVKWQFRYLCSVIIETNTAYWQKHAFRHLSADSLAYIVVHLNAQCSSTHNILCNSWFAIEIY